jgi:hypothetical protein
MLRATAHPLHPPMQSLPAAADAPCRRSSAAAARMRQGAEFGHHEVLRAEAKGGTGMEKLHGAGRSHGFGASPLQCKPRGAPTAAPDLEPVPKPPFGKAPARAARGAARGALPNRARERHGVQLLLQGHKRRNGGSAAARRRVVPRRRHSGAGPADGRLLGRLLPACGGHRQGACVRRHEAEARMGASLLRLHFHDCFVNVRRASLFRL